MKGDICLEALIKLSGLSILLRIHLGIVLAPLHSLLFKHGESADLRVLPATEAAIDGTITFQDVPHASMLVLCRGQHGNEAHHHIEQQ